MSKSFLNVLVVDDDDVAAESVMRSLKKADVECQVVVAQDGIDALEVLRGTSDRHIQRPFVILLDLNMPRMNGFEFLEALRAESKLRDSIVFVLTTSDADSDRSRAYHEFIAGYMVKSSVGPQFSKLSRLLSDYASAIKLPD
jgi:CheY-like chemotaxis protein